MANPVKIRAVVAEATHHSPEVASYRFKPLGRVPKFLPGQYLHLALDPYDPARQWPESRAFSIASSPEERDEELVVTIAAKGAFTGRILDTLEKGSECHLKLPYGEFHLPPARHLTLVAGGIGLTPFLSLLRQMLAEKSPQPVRLFYGIRSVRNHHFGDLLERCTTELPNFRKTVYCEDGSVPGEVGQLNAAAISSAGPPDTLFCLSGPPAMVTAFKKHLSATGVGANRICVDNWE